MSFDDLNMPDMWSNLCNSRPLTLETFTEAWTAYCEQKKNRPTEVKEVWINTPRERQFIALFNLMDVHPLIYDVLVKHGMLSNKAPWDEVELKELLSDLREANNSFCTNRGPE